MTQSKPKVTYKAHKKQKTPAESKPAILPVVPGNGATADINFEQDLWQAAVQLRGNIAPSDYKHFVLPLLFLRYISLKYERRYAQLDLALKDPASDYFTSDLNVAKEVLNDPDEYKRVGAFIIPKRARWDYLVQHAQDDDIAIKLDDAMELLEKTYPELRGVLPRKYAGSNLSRENVSGLINLFSRDSFKADAGRESDLLGRVYEYFITNFASTEGTRGGEFFTPRAVVKLLVAMMEPRQGQIFDPACGSGGMFVQSALFAQHSDNLSFFGQESVDTTLRLGKMNLLLHGLNGDIQLGNSLLDDKFPNLRADFVIANPPFNTEDWGADRVSPRDKRLEVGSRKCLPTNSNANFFWMMHFLFHLKSGGTAGYVMANGAMTTNLKDEKDTRTALVEEGLVDCIVQLPDKLFFGTGIPACLWFLSRNRDGRGQYRKRVGEILFIDARKKGTMVNRRQRVLTDEDIAGIAAVYHHYRDVEGERQNVAGFCRTATLDEVKANGCKLTPGVYVGTEQEVTDDTPFEVKMAELTAQLKAQFAESNTLQEKIVRELEMLS
ncbi:MAG: class I SAM-dependent DNA methyltransferase [Anaerolineae bacterium]